MSDFIQHIIIDNTLKRIGETAFADKLCITSKYLSEVCKKVSGLPGANVEDGTPIHGAEAANADSKAREIAGLV